MSLLAIILFCGVKALTEDCDPTLADCVTPPNSVAFAPKDDAMTQLLSGAPQPLQWLNPIPIPTLAPLDFNQIMTAIEEQAHVAKEQGLIGFMPTLPPFKTLPGASIEGNAARLMAQARSIADLAGYQQGFTTTPSPYQTIPLKFGDLPSVPTSLPIMSYKPDIAGFNKDLQQQQPFIMELQDLLTRQSRR